MKLENLWINYQAIVKDGIDLTTFNEHLRLADLELLEVKTGGPNAIKGWESNASISDSLRKFKTTATITLTAGSGNLPDDYFRRSSVMYGTVKVNVITDEELAEIQYNPIEAPSTTYPVCVINDTTINVYPTSIASVTLTYLKKSIDGTQPELVLKKENGIAVYDSVNSTELLWGDEDYGNILTIMLKYIGIKDRDQFITSYMASTEQNEN